MSGRRLAISLLPGKYAICRFGPDRDVPFWAFSASSEFTSVTRSHAELSVICAVEALPGEVSCDTTWRCLRIDDSFGLDEPGVLASVAGPLAGAGMSVFAVATYDTDYLLINDTDLGIAVLRDAGHQVNA